MKTLLCVSDNSGAAFYTEYDSDNEPNDCFCDGFGGDVKEREKMNVKVHPNPTDDLLFVELSNGAEIANIALYDLQGRVVGANNHSPLQTDATATLSLKSIPAGVYLLRVTDTDGREYHRKIVVK